MGDETLLVVFSGFSSVLLSCLIILAIVVFKKDICAGHPTWFFCNKSGSGSGGGGGLPSGTKMFVPYLQLMKDSQKDLGKYDWVILAFAVGYENNKIQWSSGSSFPPSLLKKQKNFILSFGGESAGKPGTKIFGELAGRYTSVNSLAAAYEAAAKSVGATWLDFDIEEDGQKDIVISKRRNEALALLQKRNPSIKIMYTVPIELVGFDQVVKDMLTHAKNVGVKISVVNLMSMYITQRRQDMSEAVWKTVEAGRSFIKNLGASIGITPLLGKNHDNEYSHENFTLKDADEIVAKAKADPDVSFLSYWETGLDKKGDYMSRFKKFQSA
jgi:hypothetical protein